MFYIIKKGTSNFWHRFNNDSKEVNISKWEVVLDNVNQTISLQMPNGSNIPANEIGILDVIVIDETGANVNETFANVLSLRVRLVSLGYNPYDVSGGGGGATTFLGLSDVPSSYSGQAGKIVKVKATEDGLEFGVDGGGIPNLQQVTSELLDVDGYAETTDGIKAPKLKVSQFGADENGFYLLSNDADGLKTIVGSSNGVLSVVDAFGLNFSTNMTSGEFQVIDNENLKTSYLAVEKIQYADLSTNKNIAFLFPTSIVGTDKVVQWRDRGGEPAFVDEIPAAITIDATPTDGSSNAVSSNGVFDALATKVDKNTAITGATKTKITYDSKGLVTAGADLAASDLPTGIDASKINTGVVSNTEFNYLDGVNAPIQAQIDAKLGVVIKDATVSATVTGTTAETVLKTYTIPAGTFSASDIMNLQMFKGIKTGSGADGIQRIRINTSPTLVGAIEIARLSGSSNIYRNMKRSFTLDGGNLIGYPFTISAVTDMVSDSATLSSTPYNTANVLYVMTTIELISSVNSFYQRELLITK